MNAKVAAVAADAASAPGAGTALVSRAVGSGALDLDGESSDIRNVGHVEVHDLGRLIGEALDSDAADGRAVNEADHGLQ